MRISGVAIGSYSRRCRRARNRWNIADFGVSKRGPFFKNLVFWVREARGSVWPAGHILGVVREGRGGKYFFGRRGALLQGKLNFHVLVQLRFPKTPLYRCRSRENTLKNVNAR